MRTGTRESLHRRNVMLTDRTVQRLSSLREKTEAMTDSEVLRTSLALYEKIVDGVLEGKTIQIVNPDGSVRDLELLVASSASGP